MDSRQLHVTLLDDDGVEHAGGTLDIIDGEIDHPGWIGILSFGPAGWARGAVPVSANPPDISLRIDDGDRAMSIASVRFSKPEDEGSRVTGVSAFVPPSL